MAGGGGDLGSPRGVGQGRAAVSVAGGARRVAGADYSAEVPEAVLGLVAGRLIRPGDVEDGLPLPEVGPLDRDASGLQGTEVPGKLGDVGRGGVGT